MGLLPVFEKAMNSKGEEDEDSNSNWS
jgi:hypothetical protein